MTIKRITTIVAIAAAVTCSGATYALAQADHSGAAPVPATAVTSQVPLDSIAARAADQAGLLMLCEAARHGDLADSSYAATAVAHPDLARYIGPDCQFAPIHP
jgi:hypothetical protein